MIQDDGVKNIILLGKTGAGMSYLGNQLLGVKRNEAFQIGSGADSCTKDFKAVKGNLFGIQQYCAIQVMDTPGFFATTDGSKKQWETFQDLLNSIKIQMNGRVNRVFLCIPIKEKFDTLHQSITELVKMLVNEVNITIVITKLNQCLEDEVETMKQIWEQSMKKIGFQSIFFVGTNLLSDLNTQQLFQDQLYTSLPEPIKSYEQLSSTQHKRIKVIFEYVDDCLSMDMLIYVNQSETLHAYKDKELLFNNKKKIAGKDHSTNVNLGFLHYNTSKLTNFLQFHLSNEEDNIILELTIRHLVYVFEKQTFLKASEVEVGHHFIGIDNKLYQVNGICQVMKRGFYTPLTSNGHFYANKLLVSSYASPFPFLNQEMCHLGVKPLINYRLFTMTQCDQPEQKPQPTQELEEYDYRAPYVKFLMLFIWKK